MAYILYCGGCQRRVFEEDGEVIDGNLCMNCGGEVDEVCEFCLGEGEVVVDEAVYPGEPHTAPIGTRKCICQTEESDGDGPDD